MTRSGRTSLLMFLFLTMGYAAIHVTTLVWAFTIVERITHVPYIYNSLQVTTDGEVVIATNTEDQRHSIRRLDGTLLDEEQKKKLDLVPSAIFSYEKLHGGSAPNPWQNRMTAFSDGPEPTGFWYLVAPRDLHNSAYLVGYDQRSRRRIGFIGTQGFSPSTLPQDQCFSLTRSTSSLTPFNGSVETTPNRYLYEVYEPQPQNSYGTNFANAPQDAIWILSGEKIYEVRLRARSSRILFESQEHILSMTRLSTSVAGKNLVELVLRTSAGVLRLDPQSLAQKLFPWKLAPEAGNESCYFFKNGTALIMREPRRGRANEYDVPTHYELNWVNPQGAVERRSEIDVQSFVRGTSRFTHGVQLALLPSPISAWSAWLWSGFSTSFSWDWTDDSTFSQRLAKFFATFWDWILFSPLIGLATAYAARRRETEVFHNTSWFWPLLVGLTGWLGWIGYITLRPLPSRTPQGQWLPNHPDPNTLQGTEIFA